MTPERFRRVDQLVSLALERPANERAKFLREACAGEEDLRIEVESLLASHDNEDGFLAEAPARLAAELLYGELRRLARRRLRSERENHTLQTTGLVHEAYLRLFGQGGPQFESRSHFYAIAARLMRQILVDHARRRQAGRRQGAQLKVSLSNALASTGSAMDLVELDQLLTTLGKRSEQQGRIVELRYFAGLSIPETAAALQISPGTVKRQWRLARAWLYREMRKE